MSKLDLFKKKLGEAASSLKENVEKLTEQAKEIDLESVKDKVKDTADKGSEALKNTVENVKQLDSATVKAKLVEMGTKGSAAVNKFLKHSSVNDAEAKDYLSDVETTKLISAEDSLKIIYLLMAVDNRIDEKETERFVQIANQANVNTDKLISECKELISDNTNEEDYYDDIHNVVSDLLKKSEEVEAGLTPKMLVWDLVAIAYSDGSYGNNERRLLRYICRSLGVNEVLVSELENTIRTILALDKEEQWVKRTTRNYLTVEENLKEITARRNVVMKGLQDLIEE